MAGSDVVGRDGAPTDLDAFWSATRDELGTVPFGVRRRSARGSIPGTTLQTLSFLSSGGRRIHGYTLTWNDDRPRPVVVHAHGYRSKSRLQPDWAAAGCHLLGFDVRGFGRSEAAVPDPSPWGWLLTGVRQPETSVLRGAVADYVRAVEVAARILPASWVVAHGVSLAGGLATMAAAVAGGPDLLVVGVPTFGWTEGRRLLVERGSGAEVDRFLDEHPEYPEADLQSVFAYFDAALLAPKVQCPTLVGIGRLDRVVPAACVQRIIDRLRTPHEVMSFPVSHTASPLMREWERFEERWLDLATQGVPAGFGQPSVAASATHSR